jgi:type VI secretion system protein ImpC
MHRFITDDGQVALKGPTEIAISDRLEEELSTLGFIPLVHSKDSNHAAFFSMRSCHKARTSSFEPTEPDAELSNELPYVLATSRFVHYVKAIVRDKMGGFRNKRDCEDYLNSWIAQYVMVDDTDCLQAQAQRPLQEARIEVNEVPGRAKTFNAKIFMKPHLQLDERTRLRRTVAELPKAADRQVP